MRIRIFDSAKLDLVDGFQFYQMQQEGAGHYFLDSLYSDIDSLALYAGIHPKKPEPFHWLLSKRFPYAIYYTVSDEFVTIHAVLDCRQEPEKIDKRLLNEQNRKWID